MAVRLAPQRPARAPRPVDIPEARPHLQLVPPDYVTARARRRRARRLAVLAGVTLAAAMFGVVAFHVVLTQKQLDIQRLQTRADSASVRQQQLRLEMARLESPERVVQDAQRIGMVPPATIRYLAPPGEAPLRPPTSTPRTTASTPRPTTPATRPGTTPSSTPKGTTATTVKRPVPTPTTPKVSVPKPTPTSAPSRTTR